MARISPSATIFEASKALGTRRIGAVLVMDAAGQLLGILSERDIVASLAEHGASTLEMTAAQLMTRNLKTATPRTTVEEAMEMMTTGRFRHLPVVDGGHLAGIVSIGDIREGKDQRPGPAGGQPDGLCGGRCMIRADRRTDHTLPFVCASIFIRTVIPFGRMML